MVIWYFKQIGKVKSLISHELTGNPKKMSFWSVFSYSMQQQRTISQLIVMCDEKWILYQITLASSVVGPGKAPALPQTELALKKRSRSLVWWSSCQCDLSFWILLKPLHLRSRLNKLMRCTKNCKASSQHWSAELVTSSLLHDSILPHIAPAMLQRTNWTVKFCPTGCIHLTSHQPTSASSSISTAFCRQTPPQPVGDRKCLQEFKNPEERIFMLQE